jgi:hypothetical protein
MMADFRWYTSLIGRYASLVPLVAQLKKEKVRLVSSTPDIS